ncbi:hypothetical protein [Pseudoalteromonas luteoviolacea]|uniref:Uncharacterized protein n=1 Tax=Pseudoalteromonas luteoviolacea S4060-1 TaxID=1365257 RepID=A0A167NVQ5_9GAMM|nr:hypothetical protein [Pseudoalteromonas luteoviolacea]KZN31902.1 hypothetical protein N480_01825 [Pseudoalteromonas luteoviolacea S2607]KZN68921.1 hypothetical protein N478_13435 [Pseudoalteromonas luteoviolacea S4060-1]
MKVLFSLTTSLLQKLSVASKQVNAPTLTQANTLNWATLHKVRGGSGTHKGKKPADGLPNYSGCIEP